MLALNSDMINRSFKINNATRQIHNTNNTTPLHYSHDGNDHLHGQLVAYPALRDGIVNVEAVAQIDAYEDRVNWVF